MMEYSVLRLETLSLHEVVKAGLPTDQLDKVTQRELAAWKWIKGDFRVVGIQVRQNKNSQKKICTLVDEQTQKWQN